MPSPFSKSAPESKHTADVIQITDSQLTCEFCFDETDNGLYFVKYKRLVFMCPNGHRNEVKDIEL